MGTIIPGRAPLRNAEKKSFRQGSRPGPRSIPKASRGGGMFLLDGDLYRHLFFEKQ